MALRSLACGKISASGPLPRVRSLVALPWSQAVKACLVLSLLLILLVSLGTTLLAGRRVPIGSAGLSLLRDTQGKPYLVIDRPRAASVMVGVDLAQANVEVYTGSVRF